LKKLIVLVVMGLVINGCASARVWKNTESNVPTTQKEVEITISPCESQGDVSSAHQRAKTWRQITIGTILIPFVDIGMAVTSESMWDKYKTLFTKCMKNQGYYYTEIRSNRLKWDGGSDFDVSEIEEMKQEKAPKSVSTETEKPITPTPITPSSSKTKIDTVTWTFANIRSGAGNEFPVVATVKQGDKLTVIGEQREWFNVQLEDGKEGWINSRAAKRQEYAPEKPITSTPITPSSGTTKIFTWDFSVVKSGPGNNYPVITTVRKGDKLIIMEQSGEWVKVRLENGQEGWIRSEVFE